ncbi:MAG: exodeoxyribonuclease VII large subunit, partial [Pseudomonadota bacterium]
GQVARLTVLPEVVMEVIVTGKMTAYGAQSKYNMNVDDVAVAGVGALMAMLEKRKQALSAEGLFDPSRKRPLPFLPDIIGVVTSPTGAVIRDILHRLRDRFPRKVLVWPVAVQGQNCAAEVAQAIAGFNALTPGGALPRPDVLIVARGGGSIEDLWGFNEDIVARAAAASDIPLISAVGHETDTTLIDYVSDIRAPTPTAAAELAVPVRLDLMGAVDQLGLRARGALVNTAQRKRQRAQDIARALPRADMLLAHPRQRLDYWDEKLPRALRGVVQRGALALAERAAQVRPQTLRRTVTQQAHQYQGLADRLAPALARGTRDQAQRFAQTAQGLRPKILTQPIAESQSQLGDLDRRMALCQAQRLKGCADRLTALDRLRETLGYRATLRRGYAVVYADGKVATHTAEVAGAKRIEAEFTDGRVTLSGPKPTPKRKSPKDDPPKQGSLL